MHDCGPFRGREGIAHLRALLFVLISLAVPTRGAWAQDVGSGALSAVSVRVTRDSTRGAPLAAAVVRAGRVGTLSLIHI